MPLDITPSLTLYSIYMQNSKNLILGATAVVIAVAAIAYFTFSNKQQTTNKPSVQAPQQKEPEVMTFDLTAQNDSGQAGTVSLTEMDGKVKVGLVVAGGTTGVDQPAHIHLGSCADIGDVKYPLAIVANGTSETIIDATLADFKALKPLAVNIHKSAKQASTYVACTNLDLDNNSDTTMDDKFTPSY